MIVTTDIKVWLLFSEELEFNRYFWNSNLYIGTALHFDKHSRQKSALIIPSPL